MQEIPDERVRVFVVWEPVLASDTGPPSPTVYASVPDARSHKYWDEDHLVSGEVIRTARALRDAKNPASPFVETGNDEPVAWDLVMVFPAGTRWEADFPVPSYYGGPVVRAIGAAGEALKTQLGPAPAKAPPSSH